MRIDGDRTEEFADALRRAAGDPREPQPKCVERYDLYADYDDIPSEEEALALCVGCPLLEVCYDSARVERPSWGVRGGVAWKDGRQHHWLVKLGHAA